MRGRIMTTKLSTIISDELADEVLKARQRLGLTQSEFVRAALSEKCGVSVPKLKPGWKKGRKRK